MSPLAYDTIGREYVAHRRADPRWEAAIAAQLGPGRTVVNVGAGTGSYEPADRIVVAVEPSLVMVSQRPPGRGPGPPGERHCASAPVALRRRLHGGADRPPLGRLGGGPGRALPGGAAPRGRGHRLRAALALLALRGLPPRGGRHRPAAAARRGDGGRCHRGHEVRGAAGARPTWRTACSGRTGADPRPTSTRRSGPTAPAWRWPTLRSSPGAWPRSSPTCVAGPGTAATPACSICESVDLGYRLLVSDTA